MVKNWNDFKVFDGSCTLDKSRFAASPDDQYGKGLEKDSSKLYEWIENLRKDPIASGIPEQREKDVVALISRFFPVTHDPSTDIFRNKEILINDGPGALGYIFSIANFPKCNTSTERTWDNYAVPLLALYSRFIYLAFIHSNSSGQRWGNSTLGKVPLMTNVVYYEHQTCELRVLLGSTYITDDIDIRHGRDKTRLMNVWRRQHVLRPALEFYSPARNLPPAGFCLPPVLEKRVAEAVAKFLLGFDLLDRTRTSNAVSYDPPIPSETVMHLYLTADATFYQEWGAQTAQSIIAAVEIEHIWGMKTAPWANELRAKLLEIVRLKWSADYKRDSPELSEHFKRVIGILFVPHMYLVDPKTSRPYENREVSTQLQSFQSQYDKIVNELFEPNKAAILDTLDRLRQWVEIQEDGLLFCGPWVPRYGRCAETLPVAGLMPTFCPDRVLPPSCDNPQSNHNPVSILHGFSMEARNFNNGPGSTALATDFTSDTLNALHTVSAKGRLYRLPCANCMSLLPQLDVPVGDHYHANFREVYAGKDVE